MLCISFCINGDWSGYITRLNDILRIFIYLYTYKHLYIYI